MTTNLLEFDLDGLAAFCEKLGEKRFRATQLFRWIHQRGANNFDQMTDLAKSLREKLKDCAYVQALPVISEHRSVDGTIKWLLMWALATQSRRFLFLKMIEVLFVSPPKRVARWGVDSARQGIRDLVAI